MSSKLTSHSESPEITGLLYKKRGGFGKMMPNCWQYRLFILSKEGVLTYYDTEVPENKDIFDSKERGRIDLKSIKFELITDATEGAPTPHTIIIQPEKDGEKWKLCADTKEDHSRWWKAMEKFTPVERSLVRPSLLNMQSDDENDVSSPGRRGSKRIDITKGNTGGTPAAKQTHNNFVYDSSEPPVVTPKSQSPVPAPQAGKRRLKLGKESSTVNIDWMEWAMVMAIVNICIFGIIRSDGLINRAIYITALNAVVGRTLQLRAHRQATAAASATNASASSRPDNRQHERSPSDASLPGRDRVRTNSLVPVVAASAASAVAQLSETASHIVGDVGTQRTAGSKPLAGMLTGKNHFTYSSCI